jgi:hypothetical protein
MQPSAPALGKRKEQEPVPEGRKKTGETGQRRNVFSDKRWM